MKRITAGLMMVDNLVLILERVDTSKFYLSTLNAKTPANRAELTLLRKDDEVILKDTKAEMLVLIKRKFDELEKAAKARSGQSKEVTTEDKWLKDKLANVASRLKALDLKTWVYSLR